MFRTMSLLANLEQYLLTHLLSLTNSFQTMCFQCQRIFRLVKDAVLISPGNEVGPIH